jgi:hypothetical protein
VEEAVESAGQAFSQTPPIQRVVKLPLAAKSEVVVAAVPVAFTKVKFWKVLEPVSKRFERVVSPPVAVSVPVKLAVDEMVWPFTKPEVMAPRVEFPALRAVAKRFVEEAVVAKKLVVVAAVVVERTRLGRN